MEKFKKSLFAIIVILLSSNLFTVVYFLSDYDDPSSQVISTLKQKDVIIPAKTNVSDIVQVESNPLIIPDRKNETDILVMVMGELNVLSKWYNILKAVDASFSFIYASFDTQISQEQNATYIKDANFPFKVIFIPGTTWTEGRNLLAEEAVRLEKRRGKKFSHWLFMDDDVTPTCQGHEIRNIYGDESCWQNVFNFISSSKIPDNISTIAAPAPFNGKSQGLLAASTADAFFAAFKRDYVPYVLPYGKLREGFSEWMSQAALFCIMRTCLERSVVFIPYINFDNSRHREYIRGKEMDQMKQTLKDNFVTEELGFENCMNYTVRDIDQKFGATKLLPISSDKFSSLIPSPELTKCAPLKKRFETWEKSVLLAEE